MADDPYAAFASPVAAAAPAVDPYAAFSTPAQATSRGFKERAEDVLTRVADSATFGLAPKLSAKLGEWQGKGTYDEILARRRQEVEDAGKRLGTAGSIASDVGGGLLTGAALTNAGLTLSRPAAPLLARMAAGGVEGAGYGAAYGAGHTDTGKIEDYIQNAGDNAKVGFLFGNAAPAVLAGARRLITPAPAESAERLRLAQVLQNEGVPVTAADRTGSVALGKLEDQTGKMPLGKLLADPSHRQMEALTARAAERSGIPAGEIPTDRVLAATNQAVGGRIGAIQKQYPVALDRSFANDLTQVIQDIPLLETAGKQNVVKHILGRLAGHGQPTIDPALASATRSQLRRAISSQNGPNGDKQYQGILIDIRNALDEALTRTVQAGGNPGHVSELATARQQYANLQVLQDALYRSGAQGQLGVLTPTALQSAQAASLGKAGYMQGRGDLTELAKGSSALLRAPQDSGTASNVATMNPLKWLASLGGQTFITNPVAQRYWGNQLLQPGVENTAIGPAVAGLLAGRDERRRKGLLSP